MLHSVRFFVSSSKCRLFYNATFFGSCIIHSICCNTLHTMYVHVLQTVLPVILARNMSAPWG
jgi:hypothetical protein